MKLLKIQLGDDKTYTVSTFPITKIIAFRKEFEVYKNMETEINKIMFELTPDGKFKLDENKRWVRKPQLTEDEEKKLIEIQDRVIAFGIGVLRRGLSKFHKEFIKVDDPIQDKAIDEKTGDLIDLEDLRNIIQFCFNGQYIKEERVIEINLTMPPEGGDADK